jgi:hypothetical protein
MQIFDNNTLWRELFDYWKSKCVGGRPPMLRDLDPVIDIPRIVMYLVLLDVVPDGFRYRLIGSDHSVRWGQNMKGELVGSTDERVRDAIVSNYRAVAEEQTPRLRVGRNTAGGAVRYVLLALPLVNAQGATEHVLSGAFYDLNFKKGESIAGLTIEEAIL